MIKHVLASLCAAAVLIATPASAQYPDRPIKLVLPLPAGSATDSVARVLARSMERSLRQPIVIENRAGADGAIAAQAVARAEPDGYTLFFATNSPMSAVPAMKREPGYDPTTDFTPISLVGRYSSFLWVNADVPIRSLQELIIFARANPGKLTYATGNTGGQVAMLQLLTLAGRLSLTHVPYRGEPAAIIDVVSGRIPLMFATPTTAGSFAKEGKLRALVTTLAQRSTAFPDVPTVHEAGLPGFSITLWAGIVGPAGMPADIVRRLNEVVQAAIRDPEVVQSLQAQQFFGEASTAADLRRMITEQLEAYRVALRGAGVEPN
ncbi:tripartite tricarboxylate transporter substrate binding protein [Phreatobacter aquaticus]|uniref:Tripartite tricarboxylate transporter substrate binding protein n=1 Tax=Phreatobacter aquaticus TaxID=2570229 RepID=A0A4D7QRM3_9HYPH|nr:tripartite tricarboxylate transporter substrate binding protein [Phreatobacter aquaticus]QCK87904.1 tripartite tricarboxylate transporter substrate binding protein [Phreatobacter aquaticus]